jgi:murein DD-endopeptidase MepM/ murein hydrolase activator NlpD
MKVISGLIAAALLLSACAPEFNPPPGYKGGFLMGTDVSRTIVVEKGDTLYIISRRYDVPTKVIADRNGLKPPFELRVGQTLILDPNRTHVVKAGDTLQSIAIEYSVDEHVLASSNQLQTPYRLSLGQELWIPDPITNVAAAPTKPVVMDLPPIQTAPLPPKGQIKAQELPPPPPSPDAPLPPTEAPPPAPIAPMAPPPAVPAPPPEKEVAIVAPRNPIPEPAARASAKFTWPLSGKIIARFGLLGPGLHNDGINITAAPGTEVRAADNGVVAYAGNELKGFGNLLLLKHADGWTTAYAHNDRLLVKRGDVVKQGQAIATVGKTGNVDAPQLHFEVRKGTQAMNPEEYLAKAPR